MFTLGNVIFLVIMFFIIFAGGWAVAVGIFECDNTAKEILVPLTVAVVITLINVIAIGWYNTSTASGIRAVKDWKSEVNNGINREILITAEDGREIFHYEGKVDIESNHTDNYIKFESEDGKRYIVYYGIQDTIQIIEK